MNPLVQSNILSHPLNGLVHQYPHIYKKVVDLCVQIEQQQDVDILRNPVNVNKWIQQVNHFAAGTKYSTLRVHAKTAIIAAFIARFFDLHDARLLDSTEFEGMNQLLFQLAHPDICKEIASTIDISSLQVEPALSSINDLETLRYLEMNRLTQLCDRFYYVLDQSNGLGLETTKRSEAIFRAIWLLYENETFVANGSHASAATKRRYKLFCRKADIDPKKRNRSSSGGEEEGLLPVIDGRPQGKSKRVKRERSISRSESDDNSSNEDSFSGWGLTRQPCIPVV